MKAAWLALIACAVTGCAVVSFLPGEEPIYLVIRGGSPFWTYGPQQAGLPDERLDLGDTVRIVRWEYGFSRVQLESGLTGYVANDDLEKAPDGTLWLGNPDLPAIPKPRGPQIRLGRGEHGTGCPGNRQAGALPWSHRRRRPAPDRRA